MDTNSPTTHLELTVTTQTPTPVAEVVQIPGIDLWTIRDQSSRVTTTACFPTLQEAQDHADLLNRCTISNTELRGAYDLDRGDIVSDGMGSYHLVVEAGTVTDTWDSRSLRWVRTRTVAGLHAVAYQSFRYELDDEVLTVRR